MSKSDQALEISSNSKTPNPYDIEELYKIIRVQQGTINKLSLELGKKSQTIPREHYETALNDLETERYEHSKTKLELLESRDKLTEQQNELDFFKNELEKERSAYSNVFDLLKDKALNESTKSIDLISKIAETEIRYNDAMQDMNHKEKMYEKLCGKIKSKERSYEHKMQELDLKAEQDKFINKLINEPSHQRHKTGKK